MRNQVIREHVPDALISDCDKGTRPDLVNAGVMYSRMITAEKNLDICASKMPKIREWNASQRNAEQ